MSGYCPPSVLFHCQNFCFSLLENVGSCWCEKHVLLQLDWVKISKRFLVKSFNILIFFYLDTYLQFCDGFGHTSTWVSCRENILTWKAGLWNGEHSRYISQWLFFPYLCQGWEIFLGIAPWNLLGFLEFNLFHKCGLSPQTWAPTIYHSPLHPPHSASSSS